MAILSSKINGDIKVQCGKKLEYLGMDLDHTVPGEGKISMIPYIENILKDFSEEIVETAATPAGEHLLEVWEGTNSTKLPESQSIMFHHDVAKLPFICNHAKHDLQTPVQQSFKPDEDDWEKLKHVLKYLNETCKLIDPDG